MTLVLRIWKYKEQRTKYKLRNTTTPVGISEKGWVIAYSADWYLYLSLNTQPNIE